MNPVKARIQALNDLDAQRILTTFARHQPGYTEQALTEAQRQALQNQAVPSTAAKATSGEVARAALRVLADEVNQAQVIEALVSHPPPQQYGFAEGAAVLGAVLFVLGCYFEVKRDKNGQWTFTVRKQPADTQVLKQFLETLSGFTKNLKIPGDRDLE